MKLNLSVIFVFLALLSCGKELEYKGPHFAPSTETSIKNYHQSSIWKRHKDSPLKILAIGNSFTNNATVFMPWLLNHLAGDSICVATLTQSGCSLTMHWENHYYNSQEYDMYYSDCGGWEKTEFTTMDDALLVLDWDIIVIQQVSGYSGVYSSFQPALDYLVRLFKEIHPDVKIAWHYTWAYRPRTQHKDFCLYKNDARQMYEAILEAGDRAMEYLDIKIPSATLIWQMREQYPEVNDGFSYDGYHISSDLASFALSSLWYEILVRPYTDSNVSSIDITEYPSGINPKSYEKANAIIRNLLEN